MNAILELLGKLGLSWLSNRAAEEANKHAEALATANVAEAVEWSIGRGQGRFGAFVDAYTRLMRPLILTGSMAGIVWIVWLCYVDPTAAAAFLQAVAMAEDILLMLLVFPLAHFGIRPFEKSSIFRRAADVALARAQAHNIKTLQNEADTDERLRRELDDTSKPLSNWAIVEINRRMQAGRPIR